MEPKDSSRERQEKEEKSLDTLPPLVLWPWTLVSVGFAVYVSHGF